MVQEGILLGHKIPVRGIKVDKLKVDVIDKLPPPINKKGVRSFLGQVGFTSDSSKISQKSSNHSAIC